MRNIIFNYFAAVILIAFILLSVPGNLLANIDKAQNRSDHKDGAEYEDKNKGQNISPGQDNDNMDTNQEKTFKLYMKSENEIELYSDIDENYCLITRFNKKDWGTWNICGWSKGKKINGKIAIPAKNSIVMAGTGTDWEYVLRVSGIGKSLFYFSGGNHANEELIDISFLIYPEGKNIELTPGQIIDITELKVIENTSLNIDEQGIKNYANVRREYSFRPYSIELSATFVFNTDVLIGASYVSMMPIKKEYGRYFMFDNIDSVYSTVPKGYTKSEPGKEYYLGKVEAVSTVFWGDANPDYKFRAWIESPEMVDYFKNELKTFVWDFNIYDNKLYYSKYDIQNPTKIEAGTIWKHIQGWEFIKE